MIGKLLTGSDGKIPYMQILIGILIGAIGMLVYAKMMRPKILFEDNIKVPIGPSILQGKQPKNVLKQRTPAQPVVAQTSAVPVQVDMNSWKPGKMNAPSLPPLFELHPSETEDDTETEEDEDEEEDEQEQIQVPMGMNSRSYPETGSG